MSFSQHNKSVTVERLRMIESIKNGLAIHTAAYNEAKADFQDYAQAEITKLYTAVMNDDFSRTSISLQAPVSHIQEYNDAIELFEMSVSENIEIDIDTFKAYFKNEWSWSRSFETANTLYKSAKMGSSN